MLLNIGCEPELADCGGSYSVDLSSGLTPHHAALAEGAARQWNAFAQRDYFNLVPSGGKCRIIAASDLPDGATARYGDETGDVRIDLGKIANDDDATVQGIIAHELGHSAKLGHLPEGEYGIMAADRSTFETSMTSSDGIECARAGLCQNGAPQVAR